jgi:hypothetical protein
MNPAVLKRSCSHSPSQRAGRRSPNGGNEPVWSRDGRELFYLNGDAMMAVEIRTSPTFAAGAPRMLFEGRFVRSPNTVASYDVRRGRPIPPRAADASRSANGSDSGDIELVRGVEAARAREVEAPYLLAFNLSFVIARFNAVLAC